MISQSRYESIKREFTERNVEMPDEYIRLNANMFEFIAKFTNNKLSDSEMLDAFDYLSDVILGNKPEVAIMVPKDERIRIQLRLMETLPQTAGKLTPEEKEVFAFCVYYSMCVQLYDEKNHMMVSGLTEFDSFEHIAALCKFEKENRPHFFACKINNKKRNIKADDYGYSVDNPIQVPSIPSSYEFLDRLRYNGTPVFYDRIGSVSDSFDNIIDKYKITVKVKKFLRTTEKVFTIYVDAYAYYMPDKAPKGFTLV